jgi:hypothetical protein
MAKRARGSVRPGQRRPVNRRPASPAAPAVGATAAAAGAATASAPKPSGLSEAELERAAQLESEILVQENAAVQSRRRAGARGTAREYAGSSTLALRPEVEYAYVARDLRDILRTAGGLLVVLLGLWVLIDVTKVIPIGS